VTAKAERAPVIQTLALCVYPNFIWRPACVRHPPGAPNYDWRQHFRCLCALAREVHNNPTGVAGAAW
jgi:hypothetical protein